MFSSFIVFIASFLLLSFLTPRLKVFFSDIPNSRSSHLLPIPRGGGIVFVLISFLSSAFAFFNGEYSSAVAAPLIATPLAIVGLFDDRYNLSPVIRFVVQSFTAYFLVLFSPLHLIIFNLKDILFILPSLLMIFICFCAVGCINLINFMDGIDGLVAGCMVIVFSFIILSLQLPLPYWFMVSSLSAFVVWNWSPAKVFMGDVGSTYLGAVYVGLLFLTPNLSDLCVHLLIATPLLFDSLITLLRRFISGQSIFQPHRLHLYQRLHQSGWSHCSVSTLFIASTFLLALSSYLGGIYVLLPFSMIFIFIYLWLECFHAVPFKC